MLDFLNELPIIVTALIGGLFCFFCTSLGALFVFLFKNKSQKLLTMLLSCAGGVMIASAYFSLLEPAINYCEGDFLKETLLVVLGFFCGGIFIGLANHWFDKKLNNYRNKKFNVYKRNILLTGAITLHNIPEGMAVGVAFSFCMIGDISMLILAITLCIGIGIQNIPEGASVSIPLNRDGLSAKKSFLIGVLSGIVEPITAVIACALAIFVLPILPFFLAFSSGAMMLVALTEMIPESLKQSKIQTIFFVSLGFCIMSFLDIVLG